MSRKQEFDGVYKNKALEVIVSASLTINLYVLCHALLPWIYRLGRSKLFSEIDDTRSKVQVSRLYCSVPFYIAIPACGLVLLFSSDILQNPFFAFDRSLCIVFSSALGQYIYKSAEAVYWNKDTNCKPLLVHHVVVIAIYTVIIHYEQCAIIGLVGLLMEGSFAFAECDKESFPKSIKRRRSSFNLRVTFLGMLVVSVTLKGVLPGLLIVYSIVTSSADLLKMQYVPLAFFFLGLVFFAAVAGWFFKDAFCGVLHIFGHPKPKHLWYIKHQPVVTVINHNGLEKLMEKENGMGTLHIKCNDLWDQDFASMSSAHALESKVKNVDVIEVECATTSVLQSANVIQ